MLRQIGFNFFFLTKLKMRKKKRLRVLKVKIEHVRGMAWYWWGCGAGTPNLGRNQMKNGCGGRFETLSALFSLRAPLCDAKKKWKNEPESNHALSHCVLTANALCAQFKHVCAQLDTPWTHTIVAFVFLSKITLAFHLHASKIPTRKTRLSQGGEYGKNGGHGRVFLGMAIILSIRNPILRQFLHPLFFVRPFVEKCATLL